MKGKETETLMNQKGRINKIKTKMLKASPYIIFTGLAIGFYSALIPFNDWFDNDVWEDRLYFRGVLLGFLLVSIGSAILVKDKFIRSGIVLLGSCIFSLIFISTLNLLIDDPVSERIMTENYFRFSFISGFVVFVILIILRLWLNKLLELLRL